jgi:senataxin
MLRAHADFVISVAFAASYSTSSWAQARTACRSLLEALFLSDVDAVRDGIKGACRAMHKDYKDTELAPPIINTVLWTRTFELVGGPGAREDADANCLLLRVVASSAHCAALNAAVFRETFTKNPNVEKTVTNVNAALTTFHVGFAEAFSGFTDSQPARAVESLLRKPGMVRAAIALLMSPSPDLQAAGKALIGQAFDVDGRAETFRALFERLPNDTYEGVLACLGRYLEIAPALVEACAWSRAIVTCLTDVIDVLCASSSGILTGDRHFESVDQDDKPAARHLQPLWKKMADVSCLIFKRTPNWSRALGDEPEIRQMMTTWMRDALIFGRDILAYRRTFEDAIVRARQLGSTKRNEGVRDDVRKEVLGRLNPVFEETSRWLRLTDAELLHQSFSLFEGLAEALKSSDIRPPQAVLDKLKSQFKAGRQHQLDGMRMTKITQILADFDEEESDEEVEEVLPDSDDVVEVVPAPKAEERPIVVKPKMAVGNWLSAATSKSKPKQTTRPPAPNVRSSAAMNDIRRAAVAAQPRFSKKDIIRGGPPNPRLASSSRTPLPLPPLREGHRIKSESASVASSEANSSDSSEDSDGEPKGLAALGNFVKTPKIKKPVERRTIMVVDDVDVKLKRGHFGRFNRADEARRTAMRLKPDVSTLHRIVLGWDYEHSGDMPPDMQEKSRPSRVSDTFGSYGDYRRTFETLLIIEAWAGLVQSKSEPKETYPIKITSRQTVDDWTDMDIEITDTVRKEWYMSDVDVVLLKHPETDKYLLAKVQSYRAMRDSITGSLRVRLGNAASDPGLHINSKWVIAKIFS